MSLGTGPNTLVTEIAPFGELSVFFLLLLCLNFHQFRVECPIVNREYYKV